MIQKPLIPRPDAIDPTSVTDTNSLFSQGNQTLVTTDFQIKNRYERDGRLYMMGISSPGGFNGQSAAFVQLAAPTLLWVADWTGCQFLTKPVVPDPTTVGNNWQLLDVDLTTAQVVLAPDGVSPLYRITGTYTFGCLNPGNYFYSNVQYPVAPWWNSTGIANLRAVGVNDIVNAVPLLIAAQQN